LGGYVDLEGEVLPHLNVGIAGRSENYSDFGGTNNGKISARYELSPAFAIRGAASTGLRAPSIGQLDYTRTTGIFVNNVQYLQRVVQPNSAAGAALGAKPLQPENSTSYTAGFVFTGWDNSVLTVDGYDIHVGHRIVFGQSLTGTAVSGILANAGFPGLQGAQYFTNGVSTHTQGVDVTAHKTLQFDDSSLLLSAGFSLTGTAITSVAPNPPQLPANVIVLNRQTLGVITNGAPNSKVILGADYNWGSWTFSPKATRYGNYKYLDLTNPALDQTFSSQWIADLTVAFQVSPGMTLSAGAHNLFNSFPDKQIVAERSPNVSEYSVLSPDGAFGTQLFVRLAASL
jgi:iron complex outermembrane receptor protein